MMPGTMDFGLFFLMQRDDAWSERAVYDSALEQMLAAESLGYHSVWIAEHHFSDYGLCPAPPVLASFVAARTATLRLGMGVSLLPLHHPVDLAEQLATLDIVTGGRLDVGIGRGGTLQAYETLRSARAAGRSDTEIHALERQAWGMRVVHVAADHDEALRATEPAFMGYQRKMAVLRSDATGGSVPNSFDRSLLRLRSFHEYLDDGWALIGTPDEVRDGLQRYLDASGLQRVMLLMALPGLDTALALRSMRLVAGVLAVFTGHDLAADGVGGIPTLIAERGGNIRSRDGSPFAEPTWLALATARVRHVGEPIAMVVATTPAQARDGAEAVVVRYAARPAVVDAVAALGDGAPQLHAVATRNRVYDWECGDAAATDRAFASAAHVARLTLVDNRLITCFMEPRAALAAWDAATGRYTIHASLQSVHQLAANLARILGVARDRVRCITGDVGGGFGSKIQPYPEYVALAWTARRLGRPVKWASSRSEGFVTDAQARDRRR